MTEETGAMGGAEIAEVVKLHLEDRQRCDEELHQEQPSRSVATGQLSQGSANAVGVAEVASRRPTVSS